MDTNPDGRVDTTEFKDFLKRFDVVDEEAQMQIDNLVSIFKEKRNKFMIFKTFLNFKFAVYDTNKDGKLFEYEFFECWRKEE